MTAEMHTAFLAASTIGALLFAGIILARNPRSLPARMEAIYGGLAAGWLFCMAMIAATDEPDAVNFWARIVQLSVGMLPGVIVQLNAVTAGVAHQYSKRIRGHYALSVVITMTCVANPYLLAEPAYFSWGYYPQYTAWGLLTVAHLAAAFATVIHLYYRANKELNRPTAHKKKVQAFMRGNVIATFALVDYFAAFNIAVYPAGWLIMSLMHAATVFGTIRYRLIELTPEFAAGEILSTMPDAVLVVDTERRIRHINPAGAAMLGRPIDEVLNAELEKVAHGSLVEVFDEPFAAGPRELTLKESVAMTVSVSTTELFDQESECIGHVVVLHDLTAQRKAEAEKSELEGWVRNTQKLETLGVMAGGVAHDFNNLLAAMIGSAELALHARPTASELRKELEAIVSAGERAAELTGQMLTFAGRDTPTERPVDINALCKEVSALLHSAISKKATCRFEFADSLPLVTADPGQLTQVILNLITNASDALEDSVGTITLRTDVAKMPIDEQTQELVEHVIIEVIDTGRGMDEDTKERIFDPFFTTKFTGRGLGLATVLGIVRGHGGRIKVDSSEGEGTKITVALAASPSVSPVKVVGVEAAAWTGKGTAMLIDDEPEVRRVTEKMLTLMGYEVLQASNGREAVPLFQNLQSEIELVVLDAAMPEMDGAETHQAIRAVSPTVPIIFISGHQKQDALPDSKLDPCTRFLMKPFRYDQLETIVRSVVGETGRAANES